MTHFDYIILGAGASGLQLAYRMAMDSDFDSKRILIIDKDADKGNDRTWCFWEKGNGEWDDILCKSWDSIFFGSQCFSQRLNIAPYTYKMIRSKDYYDKLWKVINTKLNISFLEADVLDFIPSQNKVMVSTSAGSYAADKIFNSLPLDDSYKTQANYPVLQQHFLGWFIKTEAPVFDDTVTTFMDFDIPQNENTRFMYVLPTSSKEALVEYTLFSKDILVFKEYERAIQDYLKEKGITNYNIEETEFGAIPMTSYKFHKLNSEHILNIGTAGGWTKASTGYTFKNTEKQTKRVINFLKHSSNLSQFKTKSRFWFYDLLMLDVLAKDNALGSKLFAGLFKKIKTPTLLRFLDEETTFLEELKIMASVPRWRFTKTLLKRLF